MATRSENEGVRILEDFVCEAILAPGIPRIDPTKRNRVGQVPPHVNGGFRAPTPAQQSDSFLIRLSDATEELRLGIFYWHPARGLCREMVAEDPQAVDRVKELIAGGAPQFLSLEQLRAYAKQQNWPHPTDQE